MFTFGWNKAGQLGQGNTVNEDTPTCVETFNKSPVPLVACGARHTVVYQDRQGDEQLYVFGRNAAGQLGIDKSDPVAVKVSAACHQPHQARRRMSKS